ncbi:MAG: DNA-methyltransferase [Candidatus Brocadiia bacterium]
MSPARPHVPPDGPAALVGADPSSGRFEATFPTEPMRLETTSTVGQGRNRLVCADNLPVLRSLPDACVHLVYLDPPFATGRRRTASRTRAAFADAQTRDRGGYLAWLNARLAEVHRVLDATGTLYVHLDWHAAHYVKVELDKLFGVENFRNEIVWYYNSGPRRARDFGRRHDTILRYSKSTDYTFHPDAVRQPYSPDINVPASKAHYYHPRGKVMDDVWRVPILAQNDKSERLGYPTQKPAALLDIIVRASSAEGQVVADFFCGSGTALAVAAGRGRRWLGCDNSPQAIAVAARRLAAMPRHAGGFRIERPAPAEPGDRP